MDADSELLAPIAVKIASLAVPFKIQIVESLGLGYGI